jgi:adenylate cyclase
MTDVVLGCKGTIDKYIGDCIMAFWNAPLDDPEHAAHACRAALGMHAAIRRLNVALAEESAAAAPLEPAGAEPVGGEREGAADRARCHDLSTPKTLQVAIGIGINTGECVVGNMGSEQRFDYSVLGDSVNLASRLEGQSKAYAVPIIISEETERLAPNFASLELDLIAVKGKKEAVRIFALLGEPDVAAGASFGQLRARHFALLEAYRGQRWDEARTLIAECRALDPRLDDLYAVYEARIRAMQQNPPGPGWDGVFVATSK